MDLYLKDIYKVQLVHLPRLISFFFLHFYLLGLILAFYIDRLRIHGMRIRVYRIQVEMYTAICRVLQLL